MPVNGKYPTRIWDANEQIADAYSIALDDLPADCAKKVKLAPVDIHQTQFIDANSFLPV